MEYHWDLRDNSHLMLEGVVGREYVGADAGGGREDECSSERIWVSLCILEWGDSGCHCGRRGLL